MKEEVINSFEFWIDFIKAIAVIIIALGSWSIYLTLRVFELKQSVALNSQSDITRSESIKELKEIITILTNEVKSLRDEVHILSVEIKKS